MLRFDADAVTTFRLVDLDVDGDTGRARSRYALDDDLVFEEVVSVPGAAPAAWATGAAEEAVRLWHLLASVSYYKAAAPGVVDLGDLRVREGERELLRRMIVDGLGEYQHVNDLDLGGVRIVGGRTGREPVDHQPDVDRPLVPFGGGIDSIVTLEHVRRTSAPSVFVLGRNGTTFDAIDPALAVADVPVLRADQHLDGQILRSRELGFRNGHVPVTGVLSSIALLTAALHGHGSVVMSNEWSASEGNLVHAGREVNHQWSKSLEFEQLLRGVLAEGHSTPPDYFSFLRARSEVWVAREMAALTDYHHAFRSCNRAFAVDPSRRLATWCGECDKCVFIDLVLAPFMTPDALREVFGGTEPLERPGNEASLRALVGVGDGHKPFECVGALDECRVAAVAAADRDDRAGTRMLQRAVADLGHDAAAARASVDTMLAPMGPDHVPARLS